MIGRAATACLCAFFAALSFSPVFVGTRYPLFAGVVVAVTGGTCLALAYTKVSRTVRVAIACGVLLAYSFLAFAPGLAVYHGLRRLLTAALPVEAQGPELSTVILLAGLATVAAIEPILRAHAPFVPPRRRRRRPRPPRRWPLMALVGPLVLAALGCAIGAPAGPPPAWLPAAFTASAALLLRLLNRRTPSGRGPLWLRVSGAAGTVALFGGAALVAASAGTILGDHDPAQARALMPEPVEPRLDTSPLALFPALRTGRRPVSLTLTTQGDPALLRLATLDSFDGTFWTTNARYRWAGHNLPAAPGTVVEQRIEVLRGDGLGWLVSSGRPVYVSISGLGVDEATGDIVVPLGQAAPKTFTIRSALPPPVPAEQEPAYFNWECAPDLAEWGKLATGGARDLAALHRLEGQLRDFRRDDRPEAPGGHGLFQIRQLRATRSGTAEQFASAFAVLARCAGFDARVVTGFRPRSVRAGQYVVTGEDVHAWAEVRFASGLWAPFDPTPEVGDSSQPDAESKPTPTPSPDAESTPPPFVDPAEAAPGGTEPVSASRPPMLVTTVLIGLIGLLAYMILVPSAKRWRRLRRRHSGTPRQRTVAAWHDTLDRLTEAALPFTPADTAGQVAQAAHGRFGVRVANPLQALAQLHDEAAYAASAARDAHTAAWRLAGDVRTTLSRKLGRMRRTLAGLDPRPLLKRHR